MSYRGVLTDEKTLAKTYSCQRIPISYAFLNQFMIWYGLMLYCRFSANKNMLSRRILYMPIASQEPIIQKLLCVVCCLLLYIKFVLLFVLLFIWLRTLCRLYNIFLWFVRHWWFLYNEMRVWSKYKIEFIVSMISLFT